MCIDIYICKWYTLTGMLRLHGTIQYMVFACLFRFHNPCRGPDPEGDSYPGYCTQFLVAEPRVNLATIRAIALVT